MDYLESKLLTHAEIFEDEQETLVEIPFNLYADLLIAQNLKKADIETLLEGKVSICRDKNTGELVLVRGKKIDGQLNESNIYYMNTDYFGQAYAA